MATDNSPHRNTVAFIGGGNMASAILGGLFQHGFTTADVEVIEPFDAARSKLKQQFGIVAHAQANPVLSRCNLVIWAVKPQSFFEASQQAQAFITTALHLSIAAGIRSSTLVNWLKSERIVRAMPNTPALIGQGMTGLFARPVVTPAERQLVEQMVAPTGRYMWLNHEDQLDAVTALSGSGPAYVFFFLEAMIEAGTAMGLSTEQAHQLALATFSGAANLAQNSPETPALLRERVTSKGGTTHAAISLMEKNEVKTIFIQAMQAARQRAVELGNEPQT